MHISSSQRCRVRDLVQGPWRPLRRLDASLLDTCSSHAPLLPPSRTNRNRACLVLKHVQQRGDDAGVLLREPGGVGQQDTSQACGKPTSPRAG